MGSWGGVLNGGVLHEFLWGGLKWVLREGLNGF